MNVLRKIACWIFVICIPIFLFSAVLGWAFNSLWIYEAGFSKYHVGQDLGLSDTELNRSARELISYFNNPRQEFLDINVTYDIGVIAPIFIDPDGKLDMNDVLHMKDVKGLVWLDYRLFIASAVYLLGYIAMSLLVWRRQSGLHDLALGAKRGGAATLGLLAFLGVFAVTSFDWFFTTFHEIFFPQGNWQFPPWDHMIRMFPEGFWVDVTLLVGLLSAGLAVLVVATGVISLRIMKRRGIQK